MSMQSRWTRWMAVVAVALAGCSSLDTKVRPQAQVTIGTVPQGGNLIDVTVPTRGIKVTVSNNGDENLLVTDVHWDKRADGTEARNSRLSLDFLDNQEKFQAGALFPHAIAKASPLTELEFRVEVAADGSDTSESTLVIATNDNVRPEIRLVLKLDSCTSEGAEVYPPYHAYLNATPAKPEPQTFKIENNGQCDVTVVDLRVSANTPTNVFSLARVNDWPNGSVVIPQSEAGYKPLEFTVTYTPVATGAADKATLEVDVKLDGSTDVRTIFVSLTSKVEESSFEVSYPGQAKGFLDYTTDLVGGKKTLTVKLCNTGDASLEVLGVLFSGDENYTHYDYTAEFSALGPGELPTPIYPKPPGAGFPAGLTSGRCMDFHVTYTDTLAGLNATMVIRLGGSQQATIPMFGGTPKSGFDIGPGGVASPTQVEFFGAKGEAINRRLVVYNTGNSDLIIKSVKVQDTFGLGYFSVLNAPADGAQDVIGSAGLKVYDLQMNVGSDEKKVEDTVEFVYIDTTGVEVTFANPLKGYVGPDATPPIANPGTAADYAGAKVGQSLILDGTKSQPGSEGAIFKDSHLWHLIAKPALSQVIVNGSGPSLRTVVPDKAGTYTFGLVVYGSTGNKMQSAPATVDITVAQ